MVMAVLVATACNDELTLSDSVSAKADANYGSHYDKRFKKFAGQAIHLEIEPTGEMSQVFYNVDPATLATEPLTLSKVVHLTGQVRPYNLLPAVSLDDNNHDKQDGFADILAIPTANRISFLSPRIPTMKSRLSSTAAFGIDLLAGLSYTLILNPLGQKNRAPIHLNAGVVATDSNLDFLVAKEPKLLSGMVVFDKNDETADGYPRMRARLMLGTRLISSVNEIGNDGRFALEVSQPLFSGAETQPLNLIVEPTNNEVALPRIKHKLSIDMIASSHDVGDITVGTLKPPVNVTIEIRGSDDSIVSNAILYLRATVGNGTAVVTKQVDKSGSTKFTHIYEGNYDIAVIPPVDSQFAMRVIKDVEVETGENIVLSIELDKRESLTAQVFSELGQKVSGAQIQFSRIGEIGNFATDDIYDDNLFKVTATTNDDGKICQRKFGFTTADKNECSILLLDEGRYLAHVIPPAGTELAHKWITFDFPEKNDLSITLDQPEILVGQVFIDDGKTPAPHAFVTVYLAETNLHNQPKMIGNAITDARGYFRALVSTP